MDTAKVYRVTVATWNGGRFTLRDMTGAVVKDGFTPAPVRFAPRAVVDLRIALVG